MTLITGIKNFKGVVTKATTPINFATILKRRKGRVVIIDLEAQDIVIAN